MKGNQPQKPKRKKPGRKPGVKVKHGAFSLIATGNLPYKRRYLAHFLSQAREGLIRDLGPSERELTTAQKILIDRVIAKVGVLRCIETFVADEGVLEGKNLTGSLKHNYLSWANSLRLDLQALGIEKKQGEEVLDLKSYIAEFDKEKAKEEAREKAAAKRSKQGSGSGKGTVEAETGFSSNEGENGSDENAQDGRSRADEGQEGEDII